MRLDLAGIALRAVVRVMGQPITYTRGSTVVSARGEYQASHIGMDADTGLRVNSRQPVLLVNREDLPFDPRKGDLVEVAGGLWTVNDPQPDGHSGWLLMLQRAVSESIGLIQANTIIRATTIIKAAP